MDVCGVYIGDASISYGSMRSTYYRDYEQFPYGSLEHNYTSQIPKDSYSQVQAKKQNKSENSEKKQCPFCKEQKKRPLTKYLRKREIRKHNESICEDDEEEHHEQHERSESTKR